MKLSGHIIDEAKRLLEKGAVLPAQITSAPNFYVAEAEDKSIQAFSSLKHSDKSYKIGTLKIS